MFCPNCGRKNDERATFCGDCGAPLETIGIRQNVPDTAAYVQPGGGYPQNAQPAPSYAPQTQPGVQQTPSYIPQAQPGVQQTPSYVPQAQPGIQYAPAYVPQAQPGIQYAPAYAPQTQPGIQQAPAYVSQAQPPVAKKKRTGLIIGLAAGGAVVIAAIILIASLSGSSSVVGTWYCEERGIVLTFQKDTVVVSQTVEGKDEGNYTFSEVKNRGEITADDDEFGFTLDGKQIVVEDIGEFRKAGSSFDADDFLDAYES